MPSAAEARASNRKLGLAPKQGQTHQEVGGIKVTKEFHDAVSTLAKKLGKAIYYQQMTKPFPNHGGLIMNWFTNAELFQHGKYLIFDHLKELTGNAPALRRNAKYLNDQFEYKLSLTDEQDMFVLQAKFGSAFGMLIIGSPQQGKLESFVASMRERTGKDGPFSVLQSSTMS